MDSFKVFLASAFGALIGALVGIQMGHWAGLGTVAPPTICIAVGFAIGYLSYEFKNVVRALPAAWKQTTSWKPNKEWWRAYFANIMAHLGSSLTVATALNFLLLIIEIGSGHLREVHTYQGMVATYILSLLFGLVIGGTKYNENTRFLKRTVEDFGTLSNPFRIYFWLVPKHALLVLWKIIREIPYAVSLLWEALVFIATWWWNAFKLTHSEIRLLCGMDAAIGAVVGYYYGNALIGAIIGGAWGVFNFEVFSIRLFRFVPKTQSLFTR